MNTTFKILPMDKAKYKLPRVSVVMPAYNAGATIANAIMSIKNQTISDWELIIIDDGSTDNTERIVRDFLFDTRIFYTRRNHAGLVASRNDGNALARADIIALQDADDLSMPDRLEKSIAELKYSGTDVLYHALYTNMWQEEKKCIVRDFIPAQPFSKHRLLNEQYIPGACVFRKRCWEKKPFRMETQYAFDWMMHLDFAFSGFAYRAFNTGLYEYVRHDNSASVIFEKQGLRQKAFEIIKGIMQKEYGIQT